MLKIQLGSVPLVFTFQNALDSLRNEVNNYNRDNGITKFRTARQQRNISEVDVSGRTKRRTNSTWETLINGEVIEYHPSFRFGQRLQFFPKALRGMLDKQRKEYKEQKNKRKSGGVSNKQFEKFKKEINKLGELVSLVHDQNNNDGNQISISESNANPMGGRNSRQIKKESNSSETTGNISTRIQEVKKQLNISTLNISVKESSATPCGIKESTAGTRAMNESDTNAETGVPGKNMIPISFTMRSADVYRFLSPAN